MEHRWKQHINDSKKDNRRKYPILHALHKYGTSSWISGVIDTTDSKQKANKLEKFYIKKFNTFNSKFGYNATLGGDYFEGIKQPSGKDHHSTDTIIYTLYHKNYPTFIGTILEFCTKYKATSGAFTKLLANKLRRLKGFAFNKKDAETDRLSRTPKKPTPEKIINLWLKPILQSSKYKTQFSADCKNRNTPLQNLITKYKRKIFFEQNNPTKGTKRPSYVGKAISNMRKSKADQQLRDWIHPVYGIEKSIKTIDLRDKYLKDNLSISHLKKVTDSNSKYNSHKDWKLHET